MFSNESHAVGRGSLRFITVAVVVALCLGGWFGYRAFGGSGSGNALDPTGAKAAGSGTGTAGAGSSGSAANVSARAAKKLPLAGKVVVIDPGHNATNYKHATAINRLVNVGTGSKACDTTGTATNAGYAEAAYTLDVSRRVKTILAARGAKVTLTHNGDRPYGPCVDERARIGNKAHADAALSIHADGAPATAFGFHVIAPKSLHAGIADTRAIAAPSLRLATTLRAHFKSATGEPFANYLADGKGLMVRDDLGGLNLSTVPKVFIECGNMRNTHDVKALTSAAWRQKAAQGIADGLTAFLESNAKSSAKSPTKISAKGTAESSTNGKR